MARRLCPERPRDVSRLPSDALRPDSGHAFSVKELQLERWPFRMGKSVARLRRRGGVFETRIGNPESILVLSSTWIRRRTHGCTETPRR